MAFLTKEKKNVFPRAFAYGLIDNDEKVASSKEHTQLLVFSED